MAAFRGECPVIEIFGGLLDRALRSLRSLRSPQRGGKSILDDLGGLLESLGSIVKVS